MTRANDPDDRSVINRHDTALAGLCMVLAIGGLALTSVAPPVWAFFLFPATAACILLGAMIAHRGALRDGEYDDFAESVDDLRDAIREALR